MTFPAQTSVVTPIKNEPALQSVGAPPYGSNSEAWPANPNQATITATGTLPNRPVSAAVAPTPQYFEFPITAAAANTQTMPDSGAGYVPGDVVNLVSRATLANAVTVADAHGPTTLGGMPTTGTSAFVKLRFLGTQAAAVSWQVIGIGGG